MRYLLLFLISIPALAAPPWVSLVPTKVGNGLEVACHGSGPDDATAFQSAVNECRDIASQTLLQNFQVKDVTIQTEKDGAYHSEITHQLFVEGLSCSVKHVYGNSADKWVLCYFDSSNARVAPKTFPIGDTLFNAEDGYVILAAAPGCDAVLIKGTLSRVIKCDNTPLTVNVRAGDYEIIVRLKGYLPKHIKAREWQIDKVLPVYLERL